MTMLSRLREKRTGNLATAIPAISAIQPKGEGVTVARIATVAVANPTEEKTSLPAKVRPGDTATASRWWRIHYPDRVVEVSFNPEATHAEVILEWYPDAVAAEPFTQNPKPESEFESAPSETGQEIVQKAVALASEVPDVPRGIFVDEYSDLENVVLFVADLAIRQTFQMLVPREKYDPLALLVLVENLQDGTRIRWSGEGPMRLPHWPSGESVAASGPHACTCPACSN